MESKTPLGYSVSVVIATLGGPMLAATVKSLNAGTVVPQEMLICIPAAEANNVSSIEAANVVVVETQCRGQVAQRAVGFKIAKGEFVLQLDDDMILASECLELLLQSMGTADVAIAASLICSPENISFYRRPKHSALLNIYYWLINGSDGYAPGTITRACTNIGIDHDAATRELVDVEWLPGGCVLHRRSNLVLENYFPFPGKAYSEDLYHSYHLARRGIAMKVHSTAICYLEAAPLNRTLNIREMYHYLKGDFRARRFLAVMTARSSTRMYIYYSLIVLRYIVSRSVNAVVEQKKR